MDKNTDRVRDTLQSLVELFESGKAPAAIARTALPRPDIPASKWSLCNNLLLWIAGTGDARGYRQWQEVNRHVRKGAKAIYILAPVFRAAHTRKQTHSASASPHAARTEAHKE